MKLIPLVALLFPAAIYAQTPKSTIPYQSKADSIVVFFLGEQIFNRYVKLDLGSSKFERDTHSFHYSFKHPKFSGRTLNITFALDANGQFIPSEGTHGLINTATSIDSMWTDGSAALKLCRNQAVRLKKRSLRLEWVATNALYDTFHKTGNYRDIIPGDLVWKVDGEVEFRGDRYSGTFHVNVLTGTVARHFAIPWD